MTLFFGGTPINFTSLIKNNSHTIKTVFCAASILSLVNADALVRKGVFHKSDKLMSESQYTNFAEKGLYENEPMFLNIPQWHYYDNFGNKILDGFYLYGLSKDRNDVGTGVSNITLHPFLKKMLDNLVEAGDLHDSGGILVMVGDKVSSEFTPFSFRQTIFAGARFDAFYRQNSISFLTNRISYTGFYGMLSEWSRPDSLSDWITGVHAKRKFGEAAAIGGTYVNIHHDESKFVKSLFSGVDSDTAENTPTGLSLYGLDVRLGFDKLKAYAEYLRSQEFLDGKIRPKAGNVAVLNGHYDVFDRWRCGGEFYYIGSRFQTDFTCPVHEYGDQFGGIGMYQYSLVEDNDDRDEYPENGETKVDWFPRGDFDGTIPADYDKDKNGIWDFKEDFLGYDADPPDSKILFDRNNNGIPDEVEDDAYPDYPYVPSYYLPGEKSWRYGTQTDTLEHLTTKIPTHKGLAGLHLYSRYEVIPGLEVTAGGIFEKSPEKTDQTIYETGVAVREVNADEKAMNLYILAHYKKDVGRDKYFILDNFLRRIQDNIPNHTQGFNFGPGTQVTGYYQVPDFETAVNYTTIVDQLDYRDVLANALRAEFTLLRNRGFNFTSSGKYEYRKHFPRPLFNYPDMNISSLWLINKCKYIYPLPFFKHLPFLKDIFLIPKYKNVYEYSNYGPRSDSLDSKYTRGNMSNTFFLALEWNVTRKTAFTAGGQLERFDDFIDNGENYFQPAFSTQLTIKDRYSGCAIALTMGFSIYAYLYDQPDRTHNRLNNAHGVDKNVNTHLMYIKVYCGFM